MSVLKKTYHLLSLAAGFVLLSVVLSACNLVVDDEYPDVSVDAKKYINLTLYVNSDGTSITRSPLGGENGDGREAGFLRENLVSGITLILYKGTGINDSEAKVDFVRYFTVTEENLEGRDPQGTTYNYDAAETYRSEAIYTTGDQTVADEELDFNGIYHVLIVANQNVASECPKGRKISEVRELCITNAYATATPAQPWTAQQFVMTSERDATINFSSMSPVPKEDVENALVYRVEKPLLIERMSARIDYYTSGATYDNERGGYKYNVGTLGDVFVVTKVTPFNLYNEQEYLFKRVQDSWSAPITTTWLGDESLTNYVIDPNTANKDNSNTFSYLSPIAETMSTEYTQTMSSLNDAQKYQINGKDNIIIAYPKENTLMPSSYLKKYATGIAFEGNYYTAGSATPQKRVYYHYLRHQGEPASDSYQASQWDGLSDTETSSSSVSMNCGIVRNNIYRVSINRITTDASLELKIKVKMWDKFEHDVIYM